MDTHRIFPSFRISLAGLHFLVFFSLLLSACAPGITSAGAKAVAQTDMPITVTPPAPFALGEQATGIPTFTPTQPRPTPLLPISTPSTSTPPTSTPPATATVLPGRITCGEKAGSLEKGVLETPLLAKSIPFDVYLPPCYSVDLTIRYPVLYLLHGQTSTEDQWIRLGAVSIADQMISSGETRPFMMVFPRDPETKQPREYNFEEVFIHQLLATIDDNHRTLTTPAFRAIGGLSRGGAWALHLGIHHPDLFGMIGAHSTSIFYADTNSLVSILLTIPPAQLPRIWLDAGDMDVELGLITPFEASMTKNNIPHEWHQFVGFHEEKYWSAHVHDYLEWYTQNWR